MLRIIREFYNELRRGQLHEPWVWLQASLQLTALLMLPIRVRIDVDCIQEGMDT
jgi:hypothetical protein